MVAACAADPTPQRAPEDPPSPLAPPSPPDPLFDDALGFEPLPPPSPGSWRSLVNEPGQSFADYLATIPRRPDGERLYLLPLGEMGTAFVVDAEVTYIVRTPPPQAMATLLDAYFGVPTTILPAAPLAALAEPERIRAGHEQYRAQHLLDATASLVPEDAYSMTALMVQDVFFDDAQAFGFGFGEHRDGQAVVSFARIDPVVSGLAREPDVLERLPLRAFKLLVHEVGHTFGWAHCTAYRCVMNGIADLDELDATPLHLCPECLRKLLHVRDLDAAGRYATLARIYADLGLAEPERWAEARVQRLARSVTPPGSGPPPARASPHRSPR